MVFLIMQVTEKDLTVSNIARHYKVSPQSIYTAIHNGKLKHKSYQKKIFLSFEDYEDYRRKRYIRQKDLSFFGFYYLPISDIAKILNMKISQVYFLLKNNIIKHTKHKTHYLVTRKNVEDFQAYMQTN